MNIDPLNILLNFLYEISLTTLFVVLYFLSRYRLKKTEKKRLRSVERRQIDDAVVTDSPVDDQVEELREKGAESIEDRFAFINRLVPAIGITIWATLIFIPNLGRLPAVYVSLVAAIFSVIIAVAFRPFLENLFSGIVVAFFRSVRIGDTVDIDGHYGLIEEIGLTYTVLKRWDWYRIVIPNSKLLQKEIQNMTMTDSYIWAHVEFYIEPTADVERVKKLAIDLVKKSKYFNPTEEPSFWVMGLEKDAIKCWLAAWADTPADSWELKNEMHIGLLTALREEKILFHEHNFNRHRTPVSRKP